MKQQKPKALYYSHFGRAANALQKLQAHTDQLKLWANIVAEKVKEKATVEEVEEEIEKRNPFLREVKEYIKAHPIIGRGIVLQNIQGFIEYFKYKERQR